MANPASYSILVYLYIYLPNKKIPRKIENDSSTFPPNRNKTMTLNNIYQHIYHNRRTNNMISHQLYIPYNHSLYSNFSITTSMMTRHYPRKNLYRSPYLIRKKKITIGHNSFYYLRNSIFL